MVRNSTDSAFVPLLTEIHGRELITNEIARVRELSRRIWTPSMTP